MELAEVNLITENQGELYNPSAEIWLDSYAPFWALVPLSSTGQPLSFI